MENKMYVHNCPYSELVDKETIWDFSTMDIHRSAFFMGSKPTRTRLAGIYKVITADNTAISIELREDKRLTIRTDKGVYEGNWKIRMEWAGKGYARENVICAIKLDCEFVKQKFMCIFEQNGVMMLIPLKNGILRKVFALLKYNFDYKRCLFLVREQEGEDRPQTVEQFTSYVKKVYFRDGEDKKIAGTANLGPKKGLVYLFAILGAVLFSQGFIMLNDMGLITSENFNIVVTLWMLPLLFLIFFIIWINAKFEDIRISKRKSYAKHFRETHAEHEIPGMTYKWTVNEEWNGL